jgi:predicted Zn finger-like uncharacterized protein
MKFQCDRCKTRYSIADERVRGKILKIRCKNCEAVITVREGMGGGEAKQPARPAAVKAPSRPVAKSPTIDSKPVLRGAFEKAMDSSSRPPSGFEDGDSTMISDGPPPQQLEEEWYVSLDGEQFGPFSLRQAKDWVAARPTGEELYCWSEGFDDWLPIEKVGHFRRSRSSPLAHPVARAPLPRPSPVAPPLPMAAAPPLPSGGFVPTTETTPKPLFAAALEKIEREESKPEAMASTNGRNRDSLPDGEDAFEFDIGEASRVVKLPMMARAMRPSSSKSDLDSLPGLRKADDRIGTGTGGHPSVRKSGGPIVVPLAPDSMSSTANELLQPARIRKPFRHWYLLAGVGALVAVAIVMIVIATSDDSSGTGRSVRSRASSDGLGRSLDPRTIKIIETREVPAKVDPRKGGGGKGGSSKGGDSKVSAGTDIFGKSDDFDLTAKADNRPLDGDDLMNVYRDNRLAVKLCYESALKKDPLLDVSKIYVSLTVAPSGVVTKVMLSSHETSQLGTCLVQRMRRWRFRKSPEQFSGRFPLVFKN